MATRIKLTKRCSHLASRWISLFILLEFQPQRSILPWPEIRNKQGKKWIYHRYWECRRDPSGPFRDLSGTLLGHKPFLFFQIIAYLSSCSYNGFVLSCYIGL